MEYVTKVVLTERIKLHAKVVCSKSYKDEVFQKLKDKLEGKCSRFGYIKQDSIKILSVERGVVDVLALNGTVVYTVNFTAELCNPLVGSVVKAKVVNTNRSGVWANCAPVLDIIVPKSSRTIISERDLDEIKIGEVVTVEIMAKKFHLNDKCITAIGRVVLDIPTKKKGTELLIDQDGNVSDREEAEDEEDVIDEDDSSSSEEEEEEEEEEEKDENESDVDDDTTQDEDEFGSNGGGSEIFDDAGSESDIYSDDEI